jgi:hypothetical protein
VRQRNDTGYTQHVSVWPTDELPGWEPFAVADGEYTDFPKRITSLTLVEGPEPSKPKRKNAAVAADKKEGEPQ